MHIFRHFAVTKTKTKYRSVDFTFMFIIVIIIYATYLFTLQQYKA